MATLFGFENIVIFDNGSKQPDVVARLRTYEAAGVTVIWQYSSYGDWIAKGDLCRFVIEAWDRQFEYDFAMPMDCDEFLAVYTASGLSCRRQDIHAYLDRLIGIEQVFLMSTSNYNVPERPGWFWPGRGEKTFLAANTIGTLDHGFHVATSRKQAGRYECDLTHMHFHHKPHAVLIEQSKNKLRQWVDVEDIQAILAFSGPGAHLVRHFRLTADEYAGQFDRDLLFGSASLSCALAALGIDDPMFTVSGPAIRGASDDRVTLKLAGDPADPKLLVFDSARYLSRHIDVAAAGANALKHFLTSAGFEDRQVFDALRNFPAMQW